MRVIRHPSTTVSLPPSLLVGSLPTEQLLTLVTLHIANHHLFPEVPEELALAHSRILRLICPAACTWPRSGQRQMPLFFRAFQRLLQWRLPNLLRRERIRRFRFMSGAIKDARWAFRLVRAFDLTACLSRDAPLNFQLHAPKAFTAVVFSRAQLRHSLLLLLLPPRQLNRADPTRAWQLITAKFYGLASVQAQISLGTATVSAMDR